MVHRVQPRSLQPFSNTKHELGSVLALHILHSDWKRAHHLHAARCRHIELQNLVPRGLTRLEHQLGHSPRLCCCTRWPSHHVAGLPRNQHYVHHRCCIVPSRLRLSRPLVPWHRLRPKSHSGLKEDGMQVIQCLAEPMLERPLEPLCAVEPLAETLLAPPFQRRRPLPANSSSGPF